MEKWKNGFRMKKVGAAAKMGVPVDGSEGKKRSAGGHP
jgi:hypothetical protein